MNVESIKAGDKVKLVKKYPDNYLNPPFVEGELVIGEVYTIKRVYPVDHTYRYALEGTGYCVSEDMLEVVGGEEVVSVPISKQSVLDIQEGGNHYKICGIQPVEYIHANNLGYFEGNVLKYVTRHKDKNGVEDIKKAIHYCQLILKLQYGVE